MFNLAVGNSSKIIFLLIKYAIKRNSSLEEAMPMIFHKKKDMMGAFHDCLGCLACMGDPEMRFVEYLYKCNKTSTIMLIGDSFNVERQEIITTITRTEDNRFTGGSRR